MAIAQEIRCWLLNQKPWIQTPVTSRAIRGVWSSIGAGFSHSFSRFPMLIIISTLRHSQLSLSQKGALSLTGSTLSAPQSWRFETPSLTRHMDRYRILKLVIHNIKSCYIPISFRCLLLLKRIYYVASNGSTSLRCYPSIYCCWVEVSLLFNDALSIETI
jgi:hypothetical protein